jgi:itaconate CoA-transferase
MHAEIEGIFAKLSSFQVIERLETAEIANAKLNSMQEFWNHPQLQSRERWREIGSPAGPIAALKPPFNLDGFEPRMDAVPGLGEHSRAVLSELGFSSREIEHMKSGNIFQETP